MRAVGLVFHFMVHLVLAILFFSAIACASWLLSWLRAWFDSHGAPYEVVVTLHVLEDFIFFIDVISCVFFVSVESVKLAKEVLKELSPENQHGATNA